MEFAYVEIPIYLIHYTGNLDEAYVLYELMKEILRQGNNNGTVKANEYFLLTAFEGILSEGWNKPLLSLRDRHILRFNPESLELQFIENFIIALNEEHILQELSLMFSEKIEGFMPRIPSGEPNVFTAIERSQVEIDSEYTSQGVVYGISDGQYIKIGVTKNTAHERLQQLQTSNSSKLQTRIIIKDLNNDELYKVEGDLHKAFGKQRIRGEWFDVAIDEIVNFIDNRYTFINIDKARKHNEQLKTLLYGRTKQLIVRDIKARAEAYE